jgi:hypothetical protein
VRIKLRRGTSSQWTTANPVLAEGEPGFITTTNTLKIGDGSTAFASLPAIGGGGGVSDGDKGDITVSGGGVTWSIDNAAVTLAKMANLAQDRIIGRVTAGTGVPEALTPAQVTGIITSVSGGGTANFLRADGTWAVPSGVADGDKGDITVSASGATWTVDNNAISDAKLRDSNGYSVIGRQDATIGDPGDIIASSANTVLVRPFSGTLQFNTIRTDYIDNDQVTNAKMANMAEATIKGRAVGAGTGDPTDLTATQATAVITSASGGGTTNFLRADGTWAAPPSGGVTDGDKGDITVSGSGATWTVDNNAITFAKMQNINTNRILGRDTALSGNIEELTAAEVRTLINVADGANNYVHPNHSGDVTSVADGATTIAANAVTTGKIADANVTLAKLADLAQGRIIGRATAGTGVPEALTPAQTTAIVASSSGGGTTNFLRADGAWAAPPAGGSLALTDLTDVTVSAAAQGQVLTRGASEFQNLTLMTVTLGPFHINDLPGTATTAATLGYFNTATALSRNANDMRMDRAGRVVGLIMTSDAARTAGTATARVRIAAAGTTFDGGSVQLNATTTTSDSSFVSYGSGVAFTAGQTIGADVVTSGWTPTTANVNVYVVVMFEPF